MPQVAKQFRRASAEAVCGLLGGDLSLIPQIEARHAALAGTTEEAFLLHHQTAPAEAEDAAMEIETEVLIYGKLLMVYSAQLA